MSPTLSKLSALLACLAVAAAAPARADDYAFGRRLFLDKAQCLYCHGWAGDGAGEPQSNGAAANLRVTPLDAEDIDTLRIRVDVRNEGARAAQETVFLFTHDKVASVVRPLLELKGFAKIDLRPGEAGTVNLSLPAAELRFLGPDLEPVFEPGEVEILVGPCADRSRLLTATIRLSWSRPC